MQGTNKKRQAHKRSSSLYQEPVVLQRHEQTTLVSDLNSEVTMKLLEESQTKSQFQLIVDLLSPCNCQIQADPAHQALLSKNEKEQHIGEILSEYFQIQSISFMKNSCKKEEKGVKSYLDLERLENEAKTNSRLRYHRNKKSKAFNSGYKLDFLKNCQDVDWNQNFFKINTCAKA